MTTSNPTLQASLLAAYASLVRQSDEKFEAILSPHRLRVAALESAVKEAREKQLPLITREHDRQYRAAYRQYEQKHRAAGIAHGTSLTLAVNALMAEREQIRIRRADCLIDVISCYEAALQEFGVDHPACLPLLDAVKCAQYHADAVAAASERQAYSLYLAEKEKQDGILAACEESILNERNAALSAIDQSCRAAESGLLAPLMQELDEARSQLELVMTTVGAEQEEARQQRLSIYASYRDGVIGAEQAIRRLRSAS